MSIAQRTCRTAVLAVPEAAACRCSTAFGSLRRPHAHRPAAPQRASSLTCSAHAVNAVAAPLAGGPELDIAKMEPLGDRILVKPDEAAQTTEGGLLLAPSAGQPGFGMQDAVIGEVLAVGSEVDVKVKKGDKVLFSKYSTSDVSVPDGEVTFVAQKSVLAVLS